MTAEKERGSISMIEIAPDALDWDEYEAEQERARRHRKKLAVIYDREERFGEEKEIEDAGN